MKTKSPSHTLSVSMTYHLHLQRFQLRSVIAGLCKRPAGICSTRMCFAWYEINTFYAFARLFYD